MRTLIALTLLALSSAAQSDVTPFLGKWNMTGTGDNTAVVYWLEVKQEGGVAEGPLPESLLEPLRPADDQSRERRTGVRERARRKARRHRRPGAARSRTAAWSGTTTTARRDPAQPPQVINWVGVRPPTWPPANANGKHTYGAPVALFDGKTMDAWGVQHKQNPVNWAVADGVMSSAEKQGNNLVSKETFKDFKHRGGVRDCGRAATAASTCAAATRCSCSRTPASRSRLQSHMSIYGRTAPAVNASKPAGEWQTVEIIDRRQSRIGHRSTARSCRTTP